MPTNPDAPTILVIASYEKGHEFLRQCRREGWQVLLITSLSLKDVAKWPEDELDEIYYMPDVDKVWSLDVTLKAVAHLAQTQRIDCIVPLDDYDLETAAALREHLRVPGMGETTTRYFRDKLAMRMRARDVGIRVPEFVHVLNHRRIREFTERVAAPWVLKPRMQAGAIGIKRVHHADDLFALIDALGDEASRYLVERFVPGDVYHVDSLIQGSQVQFACASGYGKPPLEVSHDGDVFTSALLERETALEARLLAENEQVIAAMGLVRGASHTEFIRADDDDELYFLETSGRVGGAFIADVIDAAMGVNLWAEWARIELAGETGSYALPALRDEYAGILISLARHEVPDYASFTDPEIVWRLEGKRHHIGFIVRSPRRERVIELLDDYVARVKRDHHAFHPPQDRPVD